jgi:predicted transposase YbfD/YdcC
MPAVSSSPIEPVIDHLVSVAELLGCDRRALLQVLAGVADPRMRRGVRHRFRVVLGLAVCAVVAGARSFVAIAEWAADADIATLEAFGAARGVPSESTFRRTLQSLDADAFDARIGAWAQQRSTPAAGTRRRIAVDGKTLRGSAGPGSPGRHLLSAFDHTLGAVLAQVEVGAKTNEIPLFATLLDRVGDLSSAVLTADAMHAQRDHATYLHSRGAHYVLTVKANQPSLHRQLAGLPWKQIPPADRTRDRSHGRVETRALKAAEVSAAAGGLPFPHAAQAVQVTRRRRPQRGGKWSTETAYAITSLTPAQTSPAELADIIRGHWAIEDRLHYVRDVTYDEDRSQIRTSNGPRVMASLRNLAIAVLRLTGATNIAAALRHHARRPERPLQTITRC